MDLSLSYYTSIGGRQDNEDAVAISENENGVLLIVADGLGGEGGGDIAADMAVRNIQYEISNSNISEGAMNNAVIKANSAIRESQGKTNMCSTVAALWIDDFCAYASHVGDTRIYQFRDNKIAYQSVDHSVSQMAVLVGEISEGGIRGHKDRNRLLRALGASSEIKPETDVLKIKKGDAFLLCSDGFWELMLEDEMIDCLNASGDAGEWLCMMRRRIEHKIKKGSDNHTAAAVIID